MTREPLIVLHDGETLSLVVHADGLMVEAALLIVRPRTTDGGATIYLDTLDAVRIVRSLSDAVLLLREYGDDSQTTIDDGTLLPSRHRHSEDQQHDITHTDHDHGSGRRPGNGADDPEPHRIRVVRAADN